ncbi:Dehydration-responsive element-binding protein 1D [Morus notabilis]|uniref:Dehydration responsive element binding transcription factor n=2 Tax=Morus notabilis TaxID=981085 RepID=W6FHK5_9ROSA|nr:dehydration responsive element binding transcription factor [Morus notabilis]EXB37756.1 Dehydration-responsive element-binding protein 1D [Morus notabilis]
MNFRAEESSSSTSSHVLNKKSVNPCQKTSTTVTTTNTSTSETMKKKKSGRKKFKETRHPVYKGVRQRKGKWVCELRQPGQKNKSRLWLGTFSSPDMAARAYDVAALAVKGDSASLNFPDSAGDMQRHGSLLSSSSLQSVSEVVGCAAPIAAEVEAVLERNNGSSTCAILSSVSASASASASTACMERGERWESDGLKTVYVDEEELFNMPGLLDSMAEGLILTPPSLQSGFRWDDYVNLDEYSGDSNFSLWTD